jgi:outer membrane protein assembly factor BamE (lipoprotein component of BamABCDE complex)
MVKRMLARFAMLALLGGLGGCTIVNVSVGSEIDENAMKQILPGESQEADVLRVFGAPNQVVRQDAGDMFVYEVVKRQTKTLAIEEPLITNFNIFTYTTTEEREDRLIVLFDSEGIVESFGFLDGIPEPDDEPKD